VDCIITVTAFRILAVRPLHPSYGATLKVLPIPKENGTLSTVPIVEAMRTSVLLSAILGLTTTDATKFTQREAGNSTDSASLIVTKTPDHVRPYIVRAYTLPGVRLGSQVYRFPVTGPSSDYAFTLISTAAPASTELGVLPHVCSLSKVSITTS
jgi:hypothetical protein